jgi:type II secretory pathway pseudopilin PulG
MILTESLITIAILGVAVVGIGAALAQTERISAVDQSQSQLELGMRQLEDYVRDSTSSSGLAYKLCANTTSNAYSLSGITLPTGVTSWGISAVKLSTAATRTVSGSSSSIPAIQSCPSVSGCSPCGDWGVQQITLFVTDGRSTVTRTVWKSKTW